MIMLNTNARRRVYSPSGGKLVTKQSFRDECDINNILSQYKKTGIINHINKQTAQYAELPDEIDYQTSMNLIIRSDEAFSTLPSVVRRFFGNDPAQLLAALHDPNMKDKLTELGIFKPADNPQPPGNPQPTNPTVPPGGTPTLP